jgi:hypothetical protein
MAAVVKPPVRDRLAPLTGFVLLCTGF